MAQKIYDDEDTGKKGWRAEYRQYLRDQESHAKDFRDFLSDPTATGKKSGGEKTGIAKALQNRADKMRSAEENPYKYTGKGGGDEGGGKKSLKQRLQSRGARKKGLLFGSIGGAGLVGGLGMFSMTLGPLQFVHLSEMLTGHDFSAQENSDDDRVSRIIRYVRFASKGQTERTRLGFLGNKYADKYEARLKAIGLQSTYSEAFGFLDGYKIDKESPEYKGMTDEEIKQHVLDKDGATVKSGADYKGNGSIGADDLVIDAKDLGVYKQRKFTANKLKEAGVSKISSAIAARVLQKRGGGTSLFHPIKKLDEKSLRKVDELYVKWKERRLKNIKGQRLDITTTIGEKEKATDADKNNASNNQAAADETLNDGKTADKELSEGKENAIKGFQDKLSFKLAGGAAGALGLASIPCILNSIADHADETKKLQVIAPLKRQAIEFIALGGQVRSGEDLSLEQLGPYNDQTTGVNSRGEKTSVVDADILRTGYSGDEARGNAPDETLRNVGKGTPFDFLKSPANKAILDGICSSVVQGAGLVLSFITGPASTLIGGIISSIALPQIEAAAAGWISGNPVNIFSKGADKGNQLAVGSALAANDLAAASGGTAMSKEQTERLADFNQSVQAEEFQSHSLAYRIFNPYDYRTPVSKLIDEHAPQDIGTNIASAFGSILNIGNSFGSTLMNVVSGRSHATPHYYDFGFPKIGFDADLLNDSRFANPYDNASKTAAILDQPAGQQYVDRAKKCMGVNIAKGSDGLWNVTSDADSSPFISASSSPECAETKQEWLRIRFFVKDTVNGNTLACFEGDNQACIDAGFNSPNSPGGTAVPTGGNAKTIAQQILAGGNVTWQLPAQKTAFEQIAKDGTQSADCVQNVAVAPELLSVILGLSQKYKIVLGAMVYDHKCDGGQHPLGKAVDINGVTKGDVSTGNQLHIKELNAAQTALVKEFVGDVAAAFPPGMGGIGQIDCWGGNPPPQKAGVSYFPDECNHLHIDVRKN